ncbi:restriction endonuclease subunit S [Bifidobacterium adolescentis]|nr:restriction endonuclease subunit S [Bifidobacterium adolescentis]KAB5985413.1 restriction endonuclease subunit S [Bifidobacterium adolescentis]KAB5999336.1 restriction endonuclease subunit S [Bifidobacterium adolescentis]KAB6070402.1 restriction endonuclease subunit S [Bifidobacterium adolescentis]
MAEQHEKALVPQIRFTGFTDPWEQRKLGEVGITYSGLHGKTKDDFGHGDAFFVPYTNVFDNPVTDQGRLEHVEVDSSQAEVKHGDVFFTVSSETPEEVGMSSIWLGNIRNVYLNSFCFGYRQDGSFDSLYLAYVLRSQSVRKQIELLAQGISRFNISKNKVMNVEVPKPSLGEQRRIGAFLDRLDSLITLHQGKYDKLCVLKKSMLDKMFPKGGSLYPEIRFAGFTDPWEQRKLGEVARRVTRKNENGDSDLPLTISAQYGLVDQRTFFNSQVASKDMSGYFLLHRGEFAYNKSTSTDSPWGAIKRLEKYDMGCVSTLYICFELLSGDPDFLVTYYETDRWYKSVQLIAAEGARNHGLLNIAPDDFFETQICIPKRIDEQRRIGAFFDRLDSLITLHQRKLELLRNIKKSMLDKMFV